MDGVVAAATGASAVTDNPAAQLALKAAGRVPGGKAAVAAAALFLSAFDSAKKMAAEGAAREQQMLALQAEVREGANLLYERINQEVDARIVLANVAVPRNKMMFFGVGQPPFTTVTSPTAERLLCNILTADGGNFVVHPGALGAGMFRMTTGRLDMDEAQIALYPYGRSDINGITYGERAYAMSLMLARNVDDMFRLTRQQYMESLRNMGWDFTPLPLPPAPAAVRDWLLDEYNRMSYHAMAMGMDTDARLAAYNAIRVGQQKLPALTRDAFIAAGGSAIFASRSRTHIARILPATTMPTKAQSLHALQLLVNRAANHHAHGGDAEGAGFFSSLKSAASSVASAAASAAEFIQAHPAETAKALALAQKGLAMVKGSGVHARSGVMSYPEMDDYADGGAAYVKKYHNKHGNLVRNWGTPGRKAAAASNPWIIKVHETRALMAKAAKKKVKDIPWQSAIMKASETYERIGPKYNGWAGDEEGWADDERVPKRRKAAAVKGAQPSGLAEYREMIELIMKRDGVNRKKAQAIYRAYKATRDVT